MPQNSKQQWILPFPLMNFDQSFQFSLPALLSYRDMSHISPVYCRRDCLGVELESFLSKEIDM
jgi:hypothetical protein